MSVREPQPSLFGPLALFWVAGFCVLGSVLLGGAAARGFGPSSGKPATAADGVWVRKADGSVSCEKDSGIPLEKAAQELRDLKVDVLEARKSSDGKMHVQMCGAATGKLNEFRVPRDQVERVAAAGYAPSGK